MTDLIIVKNGKKWDIVNSNGDVLRTCNTKKECVERIKNQEV